MKPKTKKQKSFIVHSDLNQEWIYNGRDSVKLSFQQRTSFETRNTIHWRGKIFHVMIFTPEIQSMSKNTYLYIIYNENIYFRQIIRNYADEMVIGKKLPFIETENYYLEINCGLNNFEIKEKIKYRGILIPFINDKIKHFINSNSVYKYELNKFSDFYKAFLFRKKIFNKNNSNVNKENVSIPNNEEFITHVCPFRIVNAADEIVFRYFDKNRKSVVIHTDRVILYEFCNGSINENSFAYFVRNDLVVDYWKFGKRYECGEFIKIKEKYVPILYKEFKIESENKFALLVCILNAFQGEDCYVKYKSFLEIRNIPNSLGVRYDDEIGE